MNTEIKEPLLQEDPIYENYSIKTPYEDHSCCLLHIAYFDKAKMWILGDWIISPLNPIIITIMFLIISGIGYYDVIHYIDNSRIRSAVIIIFSYLAISVCYCYFSIIIIGPGYLPFNYSITKNYNPDWEEQCRTFVVFHEQMEFARQSKRPPRCCFSIAARRFVLRADHFCYWTNVWIGLKNMRYFVLMNAYMFFYGLCWFIMHHWWAQSFKSFHWTRLLTIIFGLIEIIPFVLSLKYFIGALVGLKRNLTMLEKFKGINVSKFDNGCLNNFSEVCGNKKFCLLWWIPFICFKPTIDGLYDEEMEYFSTKMYF